MQLSIKTNFPEVQASLDRLQSGVRNAALASAMNKTIDQARTQMIRAITAEFNVKAAYVRDRLRVRRARANGVAVIEAALIGGKNDRTRSANIIAFLENVTTLAEAKKRSKAGTLNQLFVKVKRTGPKKPLKGAFIGNQGRTVFARVPGTKMASRARWSGTAAEEIAPVQVIDVAQMFNTKRINSKVTAALREKFPAIYAREARFYVDRFNRGAK